MSNKKINVLVLCTGNSCRSVMAEVIIRAELAEFCHVESSGVSPTGRLDPGALAMIREMGLSTEGLHSKTLDKLKHLKFDVVVTVCDHAQEVCPVFPGAPKKLHISIPDPVGRGPEAYERAVKLITDELLPDLKKVLDEIQK